MVSERGTTRVRTRRGLVGATAIAVILLFCLSDIATAAKPSKVATWWHSHRRSISSLITDVTHAAEHLHTAVTHGAPFALTLVSAWGNTLARVASNDQKHLHPLPGFSHWKTFLGTCKKYGQLLMDIAKDKSEPSSFVGEAKLLNAELLSLEQFLHQHGIRLKRPAHSPVVEGTVVSPTTTTTTAPPPPTTTTTAPCTSIPYNQLVRDPTALAGHCVVYQAQVFQYTSRTGLTTMLVEVTRGTYTVWSGIVEVNVDGVNASAVYQTDIVQLEGVITGSYSYTTASGGSNTVPAINLKSISVIQAAG